MEGSDHAAAREDGNKTKRKTEKEMAG